MPDTRKLVIVTRKTPLEELIERFNTREQARFYIEHMGGQFGPYEQAHESYQRALAKLRTLLPKAVPTQWIERSFLPNFMFGSHDLVIVIGQDGLVVNTAKYLDGQFLLAINPERKLFDGLLLPFTMDSAAYGLGLALSGNHPYAEVAMAQATLNDGQTLLAVNDLFVGQKTHCSARYRLQFRESEEDQSSSGIIISTGAGSTGWLRSIVAGSEAIARAFNPNSNIAREPANSRFSPEARRLVFNVREPFESKTSSAELVTGVIDDKSPLIIESHMPQNGVIFSDGVESDFLNFDSGSIARITLADRTLKLITPTKEWFEQP
jgi:NAD kinase